MGSESLRSGSTRHFGGKGKSPLNDLRGTEHPIHHRCQRQELYPTPPPPLGPHTRPPKCLPTLLLPHHSTAPARLPVKSRFRLVDFYEALWRAIGFTVPRPLCCIMLHSQIIYGEKPSEIVCITSTQPLINAGCVIAHFSISFDNP